MKKFLESIIDNEIILGDMEEEYEVRRKEHGKLRADLAYFFDFISLVTNRALKKKKQSRMNFMFSNYLKVAFRQLGRQKLHNSINIAGLAIGLAVSFVISLYVVQELSYDKFHAKGDRVYLLPMTWKFGETQVPTSGSTSGCGPLMKELFNKEIETYVRVMNGGWNLDRDGVPVEEKNLIQADSTFFKVFSFPLILGNPDESLRDPFSMVLTEKSAARYFGDDWREKDVLSKTIAPRYGTPFKITAVAKDPPVESHLQFDMIVSMSSLPKSMTEPGWNTSFMTTYVLLDPHTSAAELIADIPNRVAKKYGAQQNDFIELDLIPLTDVYLHSGKYTGLANVSDVRYVYIFSAIALLVLIIAIINYMNLSTARSMERAREVGVRKVVGAVRIELFWQFISESILVSFAAIAFAVVIAYLMLPLFNFISGKTLVIDFINQPEWLGVLFIVWMVISFLGGAYPATILSSFRPISVLRGKIGNIGSGAMLRKSLVVFQFAISIFLIVCTLTINDQLRYMINTKVGFDKEKLVLIPLDSIASANALLLQKEVGTITGVEQSASVSTSPVSIGGQSMVRGGDIGDKEMILHNLGVGPEFVKTSGLHIVSGTDLAEEIRADGKFEYLINESAVKFFGWTNEDAIGRRLTMWNMDGVVKGVVRDFHFSPLHKPIGPLLMHAGKGNAGFNENILVRAQGDNIGGIMLAIEEKWKTVVPASPFSYTFVDQQYHDLYKSETKLSSIMNVFSVLAIFIAGLGLFGLASYTIMRRTKELGIRKVLGASLSRLLIVVSGSFVTLVIVAFAIAAPISWYVMSNWLNNFAYPVGFNWMIVIGAGVAAIIIAAGTVFYHAFEAVRVNPASTLRSE